VIFVRASLLFVVLALAGPVTARAADAVAEPAAQMTLETFLDRLMMAESGGRVTAKNPRSTAVGPYQFIASTWLQIARKSFAGEMANLKPHEVLGLRTDLGFARRAAKIYTEENAASLVAQGAKATFANLRLAFLVGPGGAARVLNAKPETPVATLLGATVIGANAFMAKMTAADLIARAARDIETDPASIAGLSPDLAEIQKAKSAKRAARPKIDVSCDLSLPSCRRWLALATRRVTHKRASRD
jgi:Transglycosylase-like domain